MFVIENVRSDDAAGRAAALLFLSDNPDPGVRMRPEEEIERAFESGQVLRVVRAGSIVGLSMVYKFAPPGDGPVYSEIGTMRITANGLGLQVLLAALHLMQLYLEEGHEVAGATFAVVAPGTPSEHNLLKVGMRRWPPPPDLVLLRATARLPFDPAKAALVADTAAIRAAFAQLRGLHVGGDELRTSKGGQIVRVGARWFGPDLFEQGP